MALPLADVACGRTLRFGFRRQKDSRQGTLYKSPALLLCMRRALAKDREDHYVTAEVAAFPAALASGKGPGRAKRNTDSWSCLQVSEFPELETLEASLGSYQEVSMGRGVSSREFPGQLLLEPYALTLRLPA